MRALIPIAAFLALGACSKGAQQQDQAASTDAAITADNIVSNDITAIDAVTGDAANLAEAAEINDVGPAAALDVGNSGSAPDKPAKRPAETKRPAATPTPAPSVPSEPTENAAD